MLNGSLATLLAASPSLRESLPGIERATAVDSPILILGEPGTGRSALARAVYEDSSRKDGPLVEVDPAALPSSLFEAEMFGFLAGAFTGAEKAGLGRVAAAETGVLVLDHVESIPLGAQPKLLRLIAENDYSPLGGGRDRRADVRFIAIGAEDLKSRVARGTFRSDLFYRLEVLTFRLPSLRSRLGDVGSISEYLLADLAARFQRPELRVSENAIAWFEEYSWPGNLRQLRNMLERAVISTDEDLLDPAPPGDAAGSKPRSLAELEREAILKALAYTRGNQGQAAGLLGISRKSLWERRKRFELP